MLAQSGDLRRKRARLVHRPTHLQRSPSRDSTSSFGTRVEQGPGVIVPRTFEQGVAVRDLQETAVAHDPDAVAHLPDHRRSWLMKSIVSPLSS